MNTIELMNYHDIFNTRFNKQERIEFIENYNSCIKMLVFKSLVRGSEDENPAEKFLDRWKVKFQNREDLLNNILVGLTAKKLLAIMELCD